MREVLHRRQSFNRNRRPGKSQRTHREFDKQLNYTVVNHHVIDFLSRSLNYLVFPDPGPAWTLMLAKSAVTISF